MINPTSYPEPRLDGVDEDVLGISWKGAGDVSYMGLGIGVIVMAVRRRQIYSVGRDTLSWMWVGHAKGLYRSL